MFVNRSDCKIIDGGWGVWLLLLAMSSSRQMTLLSLFNLDTNGT
jgi:hypothetical protein